MTIKYNDIVAYRRMHADYKAVEMQSSAQFAGAGQRHCATFGCTHILTLTESLAGTKCLACQGNKDSRFLHYKI